MSDEQEGDAQHRARVPTEEHVRAVLDTVNAGLRLRLAALRAQRPSATEEEIQAAFREWLRGDPNDP